MTNCPGLTFYMIDLETVDVIVHRASIKPGCNGNHLVAIRAWDQYYNIVIEWDFLH